MNPGGGGVREEVGAAEGGETIPRIHCMRKGSIFNKRKKQKGGGQKLRTCSNLLT